MEKYTFSLSCFTWVVFSSSQIKAPKHVLSPNTLKRSVSVRVLLLRTQRAEKAGHFLTKQLTCTRGSQMGWRILLHKGSVHTVMSECLYGRNCHHVCGFISYTQQLFVTKYLLKTKWELKKNSLQQNKSISHFVV